MTKTKKNPAKTRQEAKKPEVRKETIRDLDLQEQAGAIKGGVRTCSRAPEQP